MNIFHYKTLVSKRTNTVLKRQPVTICIGEITHADFLSGTKLSELRATDSEKVNILHRWI